MSLRHPVQKLGKQNLIFVFFKYTKMSKCKYE